MRKIAAAALCLLILTQSACRSLDVIGRDSAESFGQLLEIMNDYVAFNEQRGRYELSSPDGSALFCWNASFSDKDEFDFMIYIKADVFISAGMNIENLPSGFIYEDGWLITGTKAASGPSADSYAESPEDSYRLILDFSRESLSFHYEGGHFSLNTGADNSFEWAKDLNENENAVIFMLDPKPFSDAGINTGQISGWELKTVSSHAGMSMVHTEKLVKSFSINNSNNQ